ncbi:MAG: hypothetical protein ACR2MB_16570, partial [Acidimicrobiales bacterium]
MQNENRRGVFARVASHVKICATSRATVLCSREYSRRDVSSIQVRLSMKSSGVRFVKHLPLCSAVVGSAALLLCATGAHAQEGLAGIAAGTGMAATLGGIGTNIATTGAARNAANPGMPAMMDDDGGMGGAPMMPGMPGMGGGMMGGGAPAAPPKPDSWGSKTGDDYLRELLAGGGRASTRKRRVSSASRRRTARASAAKARRWARLTPAQRRRALAAEYRKPAVGWLAYYAPEDRYKVTSNVWRYVSIEDDTKRYPVRYYYSPSSSRMLQLLATPIKNGLRRNRVIGFHTWQDAMQAGYRPDPVSRPAPARDIVYLASLTRDDKLANYVGFVYSGQISPDTLTRTVSYARRVRTVVVSRSDTRPMLGHVIGQVLGAAMGQGSVPRQIGGDPQPVQANAGMGAMTPGMAMG